MRINIQLTGLKVKNCFGSFFVIAKQYHWKRGTKWEKMMFTICG